MISKLDMLQHAISQGTKNKATFDKVVESFEEVLLTQMVKGLREAYSDEMTGGKGPAQGIYAAWFDQIMAGAMAQADALNLKAEFQVWFDKQQGNGSLPADPEEGSEAKEGGKKDTP